MKLAITLAFLALANVSFAQDPCKDIKKEVTENNTTFLFESPYDVDAPPVARVKRSYCTNPDYEYDNFNLVLSIPCEFNDLLGKDKDGNDVEMDEKKVIIEFDDKSKISNDTLTIEHEKKDADGSYMRVAYVAITPSLMKSLTTKKIVKFQLAKANEEVPADVAASIQQYVGCLSNVRPKKAPPTH